MTKKALGMFLIGASFLFYSCVDDTYDLKKDIDTDVEIKGNKIIVSSKKVEKPARVRYGWEAYSTGNLVSQFALPASTFEVVVK